MRALTSIFLVTSCASAFGQALISNPITADGEPPGLVYYEEEVRSRSYEFEIGFRLDSKKVDPRQSYNCSDWTPHGYWLFDRHPNANDGRWMITLSGDGRLCYKDQPSDGWSIQSFVIEFDNVELDTCHTLTAKRDDNGQLTVTLDHVTRTVTQDTYEGNAFYRQGENGIGVGREINGYHGRSGNNSFPGDIFYLNDNGREPLTDGSGSVTGNASLGRSVCERASARPPPPSAHDLDPDVVE